MSSKNPKSASNFIDHILNKQQKRINHEASEMNNYFSKLAVNLSNKENNESNLTTLLKNLPDENYNQSHDFCPPTPIIMEELNLKISQNFVGTKFFLTFVGG